MIRHRVLGICGRARVGKDTVAEAALRMGAASYRYSFAMPIRAMVKAAFGVDPDDPYWQRHKEDPMPVWCGRSLRYVMQTLGTEWGREFVSPDIWLTLASDVLSVRGAGMVVADVRFQNEAAWVRQSGGLLIHVRRPGAQAVRAHVSEGGVAAEPGDPVIINDGSIEELYEAVHDVLFGSEYAPR